MTIVGYKKPMLGPIKTEEDFKPWPKRAVRDCNTPIDEKTYPRQKLNGHLMSLVDQHPWSLYPAFLDMLDHMNIEKAENLIRDILEEKGVI